MLGPIAFSFAVAALLFWGLELMFPAPAGPRRDLRAWATDLAYWVFSPLVTKAITATGLGVFVVLIARAMGIVVNKDTGITPLVEGRWSADLPLWGQALAVVVLLDFLSYWMHRLFHRGRLWPFHAVHHSSTRLDWLAAGRVHPVNELLTRLAQVGLLIAAGFDPKVVVAVVPVMSLHALFIHTAVTWDFGPLRYVISSPRFHRWHHTSQAEGLDKNFAGFFPVWDLLFGTFYMPRDQAPERFGVDAPVPKGLFGQMVWPFWRGQKQVDQVLPPVNCQPPPA